MERRKRKKFNIAILGSSGVGKTNLINADLFDDFKENSLKTIGNEPYDKEIVINDENYSIRIFDTAGQERYKSLSRNIIKRCQIIIFVYDITNRKSFEDLENWVQIVEDNRGDNCLIGIIGNKIDLKEEMEVSEEEAIEFAKSKNCQFYLASAKTNHKNFRVLIDNLVEEYLRRYKEEEDKKVIVLEEKIENKDKDKDRGGCCAGEVHYSFGERFKARVFPWYVPMFKLEKERKQKEEEKEEEKEKDDKEENLIQ